MHNYLSIGIAEYSRVFFFHSKEEMEEALAARTDLVPVIGHGGGLDADYPAVYVALSKGE
jgi:hypothetical protein